MIKLAKARGRSAVQTIGIHVSDIDAVSEARFWRNVKIDFCPGACWLWTGKEVAGDGYGRFKLNGHRISANRVAYALCNICTPAGMFVCHECDNPPCVRPDHLFLATPTQNMADKVAKGRHAFGERTGTSILSEEQVIEIDGLLGCGRSLQSIADDYGVAKRTIHKIKSRENWAHLFAP